MDKKEQVVSKLINGSIEMITACFDEYYFIIPEGVIKPVPTNAGNFNIGDELPINGETYAFPKEFNIIDLHFKLVAKIRKGRLHDVIALGQYEFEEVPTVNMMGFGIKLSDANDFNEFRTHFSSFTLSEREKLAEFANRWFEISKYRAFGYV